MADAFFALCLVGVGLACLSPLLGEWHWAVDNLNSAAVQLFGGVLLLSGMALHQRRWKVVHQPLKSEPRLYDLAADPAERNDLAAEHPELLAELIRRMDAADVPGEGWVLPIPGR